MNDRILKLIPFWGLQRQAYKKRVLLKNFRVRGEDLIREEEYQKEGGK